MAEVRRSLTSAFCFMTQAPDDVLDYWEPADAMEGLIVPTEPIHAAGWRRSTGTIAAERHPGRWRVRVRFQVGVTPEMAGHSTMAAKCRS
jgi:hypothetical protein